MIPNPVKHGDSFCMRTEGRRSLAISSSNPYKSQFCQKSKYKLLQTFFLCFVRSFFPCLCLFRLYDSKQIWITRALCWNVAIRRRGTTNRKTRPIFKSHLPRNSSLMLVSWLFQFTNVEKSTRKTHLNSNPKASKQKISLKKTFRGTFKHCEMLDSCTL